MIGKFFFTGATIASLIFLINSIITKKAMKKREFLVHITSESFLFLAFLALAIWRFLK